MIATKAVAAILMTSLGSFAAGTAAYYESNPQSPIHQPEPYVPLVPKPVAHVPVRAPVSPPSEAKIVTLDPIIITSCEPHRVAAPRNVEAATQAPCSEWQELASGPAGRKVRMLCVH